jgi:branched-chain amino acid transport system permease protein
MNIPNPLTPELQQRTNGIGRILALVGGVIMIAAPFLPWAYGRSALDNMTVLGYPSPMQFLFLVLAVLVVGLLLGSHFYPRLKSKRRVGWVRGAKSAATGALIYIVFIGWWWGAIWLAVAWALGAAIITLPISVIMIDRSPAMVSLQRN